MNIQDCKIYLADLTYDTVTLSNETFPLNVGYIAAYCYKQFGHDMDITLFKYIKDLENSILDNPPDILALSNYAWNTNVDYEIFKIFSQINPNGIIVWGGPNFPADFPSQIKFLKEHSLVDVYVPVEGEIGFSNIIKKYLEYENKEEAKQKICNSSIPECVVRKKDGKLDFSFENERMKKLDEIPSPYTTGILNKFFDGRLSPMLQTNRGCPFTCTYCVDGSDLVRQITQFSLERVKQELEYIGKKHDDNISSMFISDLNFGMLPRDLEICREISKIQTKYNFPKQIQATTGKNSKERIVEAIKLTNGALNLWLSVQSLDMEVLTNVHRQNISTDQIIELSPTIKKAKLPTFSEVIVGLPGDSLESNLKTIQGLVRADVDEILVYTLMLLEGSELNIPAERKKWGFQTKFRLLPKNFVRLHNNKVALETEEVVVASNTLNFDDYLKLRTLGFTLYITKGQMYKAIFKYLKQNNINIFEVYLRTIDEKSDTPENIKKIQKSLLRHTKDELWDSQEDIINFYQNDEEFNKLLNEEAGINVLHYHQAWTLRYSMDEWTEFILKISKELLIENGKKINQEFEEISNYCKGKTHNVLNLEIEDDPIFTFEHNIPEWLEDENNKLLSEFKLEQKFKMNFIRTNEEKRILQEKFEIFGDSVMGTSQLIKRYPKNDLARHHIVLK